MLKIIFSLLIFCMLIPIALATNKTAQSADKQEAKITLVFKKIPVPELFQLIADSMQYNLIMSQTVTGSLALHFDKVTWREALNIVLQMTGLVSKEVGNVLMIATAKEFAQKQKDLAEAALIKTFKITLHHADVSQMQQLLSKDNQLLSTNASISVNACDNSLWIKEAVNNIPQLTAYIKQLDQPEKQILISAKILTLDDKKACELGARFQSLSREKNQAGLHVSLPEEKVNRFNFVIASLAESQLLNLELAALETTGHGKIMADPKIMTLNHHPAVIEAGEEIPYQEKTSSGATSASFKKAVLSLKVIPSAMPDGRILLDLEINQNKISQISVNNAPAIQTQELKTQVVVGNGQTVVLGGIFETVCSNVVDKVPLIGDLPLVGRMVNHRSTQQVKKQLLIMVTPQLYQ